MRTWGRVGGVWTEVSTDAQGNNDYVYITTLIQVLLLNLNESPFYADYGIPAQRSVVTQIFPDYYVVVTQKKFAPYFSSLQISKQSAPMPTYLINLVTKQGVPFQTVVGNTTLKSGVILTGQDGDELIGLDNDVLTES